MKRTTPTRIASGPGYTPGNRMPVAIGKPSSGAIHPAKTTPTSIASLLAFNDGVTCDGETNGLRASARRAG